MFGDCGVQQLFTATEVLSPEQGEPIEVEISSLLFANRKHDLATCVLELLFIQFVRIKKKKNEKREVTTYILLSNIVSGDPLFCRILFSSSPLPPFHPYA
jgi:hypothetical protein